MNNIQKEINNLNEQQKKAVLEREAKKLLVLAGAGSGKTRVLTVRIAYLLSFNINPKNIFAVTFTNKAANEMKERIVSLASQNINDMWVGTFHSLALRLIKENIDKTNLSRNFTILDDSDQKMLIKNSILEVKENDLKFSDYVIESMKEEVLETQNFINGAKDNEQRPENCDDYLKLRGLTDFHKQVYATYEQKRVKMNACDFSDLILYAVEILRDSVEARMFYQDKFKYLFVDEFQDTNPIQYRFIFLLTGANAYQTMVGDDDQLIYSWRGANVDNLVEYKKSNSNVKIVKLEQNYRSTNNILSAANNVVKDNKKRIKKSLWTNTEEGDKIKILESQNQFGESYAVVNEIKKLISEGTPLNQITILYRNNYLSNSFENTLTKERIPYKIVGGLSFWQRKEVKDVMAYLMLIFNYGNDLSFERVINAPKRGFGKKAMDKLRENALKLNKSLFETLIELNQTEKKGVFAKEKITHFIEHILKYSKMEKSIDEIITDLIEELELMTEYEKEDLDKQEERKFNMSELANYSKVYNESSDNRVNLSNFIQNSILQSDANQNEQRDSVNLMTIHASKGLEFENVFIVGFEDGVFPSARSILTSRTNEDPLEEERRLAYVAITRAEKRLYISYVNMRYNKAAVHSRFMNQIPFELIDYKVDTDYGLSSYGQRYRDWKKSKFNESANECNYSIGEMYTDELMGEGEVKAIEKNNHGYILSVDFGFLGEKRIQVEG